MTTKAAVTAGSQQRKTVGIIKVSEHYSSRKVLLARVWVSRYNEALSGATFLKSRSVPSRAEQFRDLPTRAAKLKRIKEAT